MIALLQGGDPTREIFPISTDQAADLQATGAAEMLYLLGVQALGELLFKPTQYVGAALKPDGSAFYLTTIAPDWVGDIVGTVEGDLASPGKKPTSIKVKARLLLDQGGDGLTQARGRGVQASVDWEVAGSQATRPNKASLIRSVTIHDPGPHDRDDIRRCVALHAPQRSFGEARAIIAMQCGVAAACLLEAIC
jgi:hypothetical protein